MNSPAKKTSIIQNGHRSYVIAMREPWDLPRGDMELPAPSKLPNQPPQINLLMLILPPLLMVSGTLIYSLISSQTRLALVIPMMIMSVGYPIANLINFTVQRKKHRELLRERTKAYIQTLQEEKKKLDRLVWEQQQTLAREYPDLGSVLRIGQSAGENQRLWWRRPHDKDFLALRFGTTRGEPSFTILPPKIMDQEDPLKNLPWELIEHYEVISDLPMMIDLKRAGSTVLHAKSSRDATGLAYRLLADILVHHSPEDVEISVLTNQLSAISRWEWLKWAPHTHALNPDHSRNLLYTPESVSNYLFELNKLFENRLEKSQRFESDQSLFSPALVVLLDDSGQIRQLPEISSMAARGFTVGIYLLFIGEHCTPNACRARIEDLGHGQVRYLETWEAEGSGGETRGDGQAAQLEEMEDLARKLSGLEVAGGKSAFALPSSIRLSEILGDDPLEVDTITSNWTRNIPEDEQMLFPIGVYVSRNGVQTYEMDFRPAAKGGKDEYHAFLIGTTGSGKSIFLQSMVLATAHRYPPRLINFLFMDFKAGPSELQKISDLPHVVGMIDDLGPAMAERALQALENELKRRQLAFNRVGNIIDLWDYNARYAEKAIPHLMVVIDEFAEGIRNLPDLLNRLDDLGRRGRAFGMYFMLANQTFIPAADKLKSNVGWYIVLKVNVIEDMGLIDKNLPVPPGRGRGYARYKSEITAFQGAYAGMPVITAQQADVNEYAIFKVDADGQRENFYVHKPQRVTGKNARASTLSEQEKLVFSMQETARRLEIPPAKPIYINPLPSVIPLDSVLEDSVIYRQFRPEGWGDPNSKDQKLLAPVGYLDIPEECLQTPLVLDLNDADGNLWISGTPGSGKDTVLETILLSLAYTHQPDEVQFYILEYGSGSLKKFEDLPHTGAVIRLAEKERLERLLTLLDTALTQRTSMDWRKENLPDLFVVVNNFAELNAEYPDQAEALGRFLTAGKSAGIHLIVTGKLNRNYSNCIARRIVLRLTTRDEYLDIVGRMVPPPSVEAEGRGYWVGRRTSICQIAAPHISLSSLEQNTIPARELDPQTEAALPTTKIIRQMNAVWEGDRPMPIEVLADLIPYQDVKSKIRQDGKLKGAVWAPVGVEYETLDWLQINLAEEVPNWLVLGPRQSGKSNFLMSLAQAVWNANPDAFEITVFALRRGPFVRLDPETCPFRVLTSPQEIAEESRLILERSSTKGARRCLLLIDDLGGAFEPGKEAAAAALNELAVKLSVLADVYVVASGVREELQSNVFNSSLLKVFKQCRTGLALSTDGTDLDWLGAQIGLKMRKIKLPPGRGFFVSKGKVSLVQVPWMEQGKQLAR